MVPKSTRENCRKLAQRVVEDMDIDALIEYAEEGIEDWYFNYCPQDIWEDDWNSNFGGDI